MPAINQEFNVQVNDSGLDRYAQKVEKATTSTDAQFSAMEKLAGGAKRVALAIYESVSAAMAEQNAYKSVSAATWDLIGQLGEYESAIDSAFTDSQKDKAIDQLLSKMEKLGLSFTSNAAEMERSDLVARSSLDELARSGDIAANSLAEVKFKDQVSEKAEKAEKATSQLGGTLKKVGDFAKNAVSSLLGFGKASNPIDKLSSRISRTVVTLFSVRRVLSYINDAIDRAPDQIGGAFTKMGSTVNDTFSRVVVNAMAGMQGGIEKLNASMNSSSGQRFFRGLDAAAQLAGRAIGALLEGGAKLIDFLGNHATEVFTIAAAAVAFFATQMLIAHSAELLAAAPMLLIVGILAAVVVGLMNAGVTSEQIFTTIGEGAGALYALIHNIVVDLYNLGAALAEFIANVFDDPLGAAARLFVDFGSTALDALSGPAALIDKLLGTDFTGSINEALGGLNWLSEKLGDNKITIDRMERTSYGDTMEKWGSAAGSLGDKLANGALDSMTAVQLKSINSDTSTIKKSVDSTKEDLKSLVDIAERQYINQINLTTQQPIITVNGANTGNAREDRQALADAIKEVLIDQTSSGAIVATAMP